MKRASVFASLAAAMPMIVHGAATVQQDFQDVLSVQPSLDRGA
jgi:hypothetical protein